MLITNLNDNELVRMRNHGEEWMLAVLMFLISLGWEHWLRRRGMCVGLGRNCVRAISAETAFPSPSSGQPISFVPNNIHLLHLPHRRPFPLSKSGWNFWLGKRWLLTHKITNTQWMSFIGRFMSSQTENYQYITNNQTLTVMVKCLTGWGKG